MSFYKFINHSVYKYGWSEEDKKTIMDGEVCVRGDDHINTTG
jgi:hypothetical protein